MFNTMPKPIGGNGDGASVLYDQVKSVTPYEVINTGVSSKNFVAVVNQDNSDAYLSGGNLMVFEFVNGVKTVKFDRNSLMDVNIVNGIIEVTNLTNYNLNNFVVYIYGT